MISPSKDVDAQMTTHVTRKVATHHGVQHRYTLVSHFGQSPAVFPLSLLFLYTSWSEPPPAQPIPGFPPLSIILTNTRVPKDTRALVAGVRRLLNAHPGPIAKTFDAIGAIASEFLERAAASVKSGGASAAAPAEGVLEDGNEGMPLTAECVGELAEMNHRLLCTLGVGHPALERVCEVARAYGCKTKLTGAGEEALFRSSRSLPFARCWTRWHLPALHAVIV